MPILTLSTDFGVGSPYVAAMKGVVLSINPAATVVDITHAVPPQDVRYAAIVLDDVAERFPEGTIHVAVVDPGVGTERGLVLAEIGRQRFLAPDNGLLSRLAARTRPSKIVRLTEPGFWLPDVSATFHGRDILAPVAARLSLGLDPDRLGVPQDRLVMLDWPEVRQRPDGIDGSVLWIDGFGNLITDITRAMLADHWAWDRAIVRCREGRVEGLSRTYGDRPPGTLVALVGSSDRLELAVVGGSAAERLGAGVGDPVELRWEAGLGLGLRTD
ncbi:MAG: SAM-dependent chlorinase/fluorinase [Thermoguttaceae bacterium]|jgi:S-adenosylmethionine hydrolase|nr:SAM-dependent chlorinase/fluorinase [Thermoguttaceae bacterium]